ncbi:MAG: DEAD/DEAH box helicase family protein [Geminicoccaceae bacterium]|nr:DEAD/DEAH box helicase family protein [Geminicoccaceae bacterium]
MAQDTGTLRGQQEIPIRPVERPILCSPYEEPKEHWTYDLQTGEARRTPGRRPASYWYKTERTGSAQLSLLTQERQDDLPLANLLRDDVKRWRETDYRGATTATRELLGHWWNSERERRLFFCQLEAVETLIYLAEIRFNARTTRLRFAPKVSDEDLGRLLRGERPGPAFGLPADARFWPSLIDRPADPALRPLRRMCAKLATGSGKTIVAAMLIAWAFVNRGINPESREYPDVVLVCAPNLTVKERLAVLRPDAAGNYYDAFDLVPSKWRPLLARGTVIIANWHRFAPESPHKDGDRTYAVVDKGEETPADFSRRILRDKADRLPILVINDEGHHCWRPAPGATAGAGLTGEEKSEFEEEAEEATVWVEGLDRLNAAGGEKPGIAFVVDLSATPFRIKGSGYPEGQPFPWIVSDFGLVDAIESGITKIPRLPVQDTTGRPDPRYFRLWDAIKESLQPGEKLPGRQGKPKPEAVWREAQGALVQIMGQWKERFELIQAAEPGADRTPPCLIIVCDNTDIAEEFYRRISGERIVETTDEAEVEEVLGESRDEGEADNEPDEPTQKRRGKKPKARIVYGSGEVFPELFSNTPQRKYTIRIDSKLLAQAEAGEATKKSEAAEVLRRIVATVGKRGEPGEHVRCVVSVAMLTEGWDANNVTQILGLRAFTSQLLCEQVVGRGLRRMDYRVDPETGLLAEEYCDVYGVPFSVIPFRGRPVGRPEPDDAPPNLVKALPERAHMEIRFPVVEGYVFALQRNLIRCDVDAMERLRIDPSEEPTGTFVRPQVGVKVGSGLAETPSPFEYEEQNREAFYASIHPQTILFQAARQIVEDLTQAGTAQFAGPRQRVFGLQSRHVLFPQVFRIVEEYVRRKVDFNDVPPQELGLEKYFRQLVERVRDAIEPDESTGEPLLLPLLNRTREIGSTAGVEFRTKRPVFATQSSHISHVVADTATWEQSVAFRLEEAVKRGIVRFYACTEGLGLTIPYEFQGVDHVYEPDFLVRMVTPEGQSDFTVILEVKGREDNQTAAKHEGARRWVRAVNAWGKLGRWSFHVCRNPQRLIAELAELLKEATASGRAV